MAQMLLMPTNYLFQTLKSESFVYQVKRIFLYIFDNIIWFSKSSLRSHETTSTTTKPHPITMTLSHCRCQNQNLQTPKDYQHNCHLYFTTMGSTITATQPQCHQYYCCHHFHLHHNINSPPSLTNIVLTKQGNGLYNGPLTMDTENCYPPPQKTIKFFKKKRQKKSITQNLPIYRPMHIPLALQTKSCKTSRATKYSIRGVTFSSLLNPQFIFIIKFRIIELWFYRVVYFIIIRNCNTQKIKLNRLFFSSNLTYC